MPPAPNRVIVTRRIKQILSWVPLYEFYILWVTWQHGLAWEIFIFIPLPDPNGLITGARRNQVSIRIETDWFHFIFVAFQGTNRLKVIIILLPHHCSSIERGWRKTEFAHGLHGAPFDLADGSWVSSIQSCLANASLHWPKLDSAVRTTCSKQFFIICKVEGPNTIWVTFEHPNQFNH